MSVIEQDTKAITTALTKQMGFLFIGRGLAFLFTFFIPVILARIFSIGEFGLYKQIFLISGTMLMILRFGLEPSLYYFVPRNMEQKNIYISQTIIFYLAIGSIAFLLSFFMSEWVSNLLNNYELKKLFPLIALFTGLLLLSAPIETIMVSLKDAKKASTVIFISDGIRAILIILAAFFIGSIDSIIYGIICLAVGRVIYFGFFLYRGLNFSFRSLKLDFLKSQLYYAIPFAFASILQNFSQSLHFYIVSYSYDISSFAIYSVGFLQIPLIAILFDSILEASMVKIAEFSGKKEFAATCHVISEATKKMAIAFLPIFGFLLILAKEIIIVLYTNKFQDSIGIFIISILAIPLNIFDLNYALRAIGDAKYLLKVYLIRFLLTLIMVFIGLKIMGLIGSAIGVVFSLALSNILILIKTKKLLNMPIRLIVPLNEIGKIILFIFIAGVTTELIKIVINTNASSLLIITFMVFFIVYFSLIYKSKIASEDLILLKQFMKRLGLHKVG